MIRNRETTPTYTFFGVSKEDWSSIFDTSVEQKTTATQDEGELLKLKDRVALLFNLLRKLEDYRRVLVTKKEELRSTYKELPPETDPNDKRKMWIELNMVSDELRQVKSKIHILTLSYNAAKHLERVSEDTLSRLKLLSIEEEKQKKFIVQNNALIERKKELVSINKPSKDEVRLIYQCSVIFDNLISRGIGFEPSEKRIIENLKNIYLHNRTDNEDIDDMGRMKIENKAGIFELVGTVVILLVLTIMFCIGKG